MHWILQAGFHSEIGWSALIQTLERFGIDYSVHEVVPIVGDLLPAPMLTHTDVICIGSYSMRHVAKKNAWRPGVFDLFEQDFVAQRAHWGEHMLNCESVVSPLRDAQFVGTKMFLRPAQDTKHFSGKVFSAQEFDALRVSLRTAGASNKTSLTLDTEIQLSPVVGIQAEYRFWVVDGKIITQSMYKRGSQIFYASDIDERLVHYVNQRIAEWLPHEAFVIDVCDSEQGIKIVEINTLNSSAFYAGDVQKLVLALEQKYLL